MAKKKFDTNPLDPSFPERVQKEAETVVLPKNQFKTAEFDPPSITEEQTRRFDEENFNAFHSPYNGESVPANYQATNLAGMNKSSKRKVAKIGLPENIVTALPYIPAWIGFVIGILILFFVPKSEAKVRFHAAQAVAAHIGIFIISLVLKNIGGVANVGNLIFLIVTSIMLTIFAVKALRGKPVHIEWVDDLTEWLEDKIKPKN